MLRYNMLGDTGVGVKLFDLQCYNITYPPHCGRNSTHVCPEGNTCRGSGGPGG